MKTPLLESSDRPISTDEDKEFYPASPGLLYLSNIHLRLLIAGLIALFFKQFSRSPQI